MLEVTGATGGTPVPMTSHARVVRHDTVTLLWVPASEFVAPRPPVRRTAFRHTGDWGVPSGNWDGSVWPPVDQGLLDWGP